MNDWWICQTEIAAPLTSHRKIYVSVRQLQRDMQRLRLYRINNQTDAGQVGRFIERQRQKSRQLRGYRWIHLKLLQAGLVANKETARRIWVEFDPDGVGVPKRRRLVRRRYPARGPHLCDIWTVWTS